MSVAVEANGSVLNDHSPNGSCNGRRNGNGKGTLVVHVSRSHRLLRVALYSGAAGLLGAALYAQPSRAQLLAQMRALGRRPANDFGGWLKYLTILNAVRPAVRALEPFAHSWLRVCLTADVTVLHSPTVQLTLNPVVHSLWMADLCSFYELFTSSICTCCYAHNPIHIHLRRDSSSLNFGQRATSVLLAVTNRFTWRVCE